MSPPSVDEFAHFVRARSGRLRLIARTLCPDQGRADDFVQEALERTWLNWRKLDNPDPMAWTRTVLVNLTIDRHRRRSFAESPLHDDEAAAGRATTSSHDDHVNDQLWVRELLTELARDAGAADPSSLAQQLALVYDGAAVGARMDRNPEVAEVSRTVASTLIGAALGA